MAEEYVIGVDLGGTRMRAALMDDDLAIRAREETLTNAETGFEANLDRMKNLILSVWPAGQTVEGIGVSIPGPTNPFTGVVELGTNLKGWSHIPLAELLAQEFGVPVYLGNDANVAALGETTRGAGAGFSPALYVTLGSGVGGGLVVDGKIYHGAASGETEIGHLRLDRAGTTLESRCSGWAVDAKIREQIKARPDGPLARLVGDSVRGEARHLAAALQAEDEVAHRILATTAADLAFGLSHAVHLFHPAVIVLGGGLALVGAPLRTAVETALRGFIMDVFAPGPALRLSTLGEDAVPVGALLLAARSAE